MKRQTIDFVFSFKSNFVCCFKYTLVVSNGVEFIVWIDKKMYAIVSMKHVIAIDSIEKKL